MNQDAEKELDRIWNDSVKECVINTPDHFLNGFGRQCLIQAMRFAYADAAAIQGKLVFDTSTEIGRAMHTGASFYREHIEERMK